MADETASPKRRCSNCRSAFVDDAYRPFCSRRCADIDLGRWLTGAYAIPGDINDDAADAPSTHASTLPDALLPDSNDDDN